MAKLKRLTRTEIAPVRDRLIVKQGYKCPLCLLTLKVKANIKSTAKEAVLDHCHTSGRIRSALCRNCNGREGEILNRAVRCSNKATATEWLRRLLAYWEMHEQHPTALLHDTFRSPTEKRLALNKKARQKRKKIKGSK